MDFELYGLSIEEIAVVRSAFSLAQNTNYADNLESDIKLKKLIEATEKSVQNSERVVL